MTKTVKFAVSMPEEIFKELESLRKTIGWTRSQFVREALRAWKTEFSEPSGVKEEVGEYTKEVSTDIIAPEERRRRAIAAAGRFRSGFKDLSSHHDKHLEDSYPTVAPKKSKSKTL
jgi:predicted DNA-binding protein